MQVNRWCRLTCGAGEPVVQVNWWCRLTGGAAPKKVFAANMTGAGALVCQPHKGGTESTK